MKKQIFLGREMPTREKMQPVFNQKTFNKGGGGLWTSSHAPGHLSTWAQWCRNNQPDWIEDKFIHAWVMQPKKGARILTINCLEDLIEAHKTYELPAEIKYFTFLDYEEMARDYDGIHLTQKGEIETRYNPMPNLYGWDVESTFWLNWAFEKVEYIGPVKPPENRALKGHYETK